MRKKDSRMKIVVYESIAVNLKGREREREREMYICGNFDVKKTKHAEMKKFGVIFFLSKKVGPEPPKQ